MEDTPLPLPSALAIDDSDADEVLAGSSGGSAPWVYAWFTPGLHLVYACFMPALCLVYTWFTPGLHLIYT
jgi:hypothetical protein